MRRWIDKHWGTIDKVAGWVFVIAFMGFIAFYLLDAVAGLGVFGDGGTGHCDFRMEDCPDLGP